ncbi:hypothetical protein H0H93_006099 [Arthromyces matolae]|nr:hypothetical protein H0H93_006099 [Arthromyces matolae]
MLFRSLLVLASAICLASCLAVRGEPQDVTHRSDDPKCLEGFYPGFEYNVWQFNVPASTFINKTGSFLHAEWYTGPLLESHGKDNTIGATRTFPFDSGTLTERLVGHYRSPTESVIRFSLANGPVPVTNVTFGSYTEEQRVMSICGGTATYFTMTATYCTDKEPVMYDIYERYRRNAVSTVADELGALEFGGTCPK